VIEVGIIVNCQLQVSYIKGLEQLADFSLWPEKWPRWYDLLFKSQNKKASLSCLSST